MARWWAAHVLEMEKENSSVILVRLLPQIIFSVLLSTPTFITEL